MNTQLFWDSGLPNASAQVPQNNSQDNSPFHIIQDTDPTISPGLGFIKNGKFVDFAETMKTSSDAFGSRKRPRDKDIDILEIKRMITKRKFDLKAKEMDPVHEAKLLRLRIREKESQLHEQELSMHQNQQNARVDENGYDSFHYPNCQIF